MLRQARERAGMTQEQLARRIGADRALVRWYETNQRRMRDMPRDLSVSTARHLRAPSSS